MSSKLILPSLNRRQLIQGASATGALGLIGLPARAQEPQAGGRLRAALAEGGTTDNLDPATYTQIYMLSVGFATHSTLTEIAPDGTLVGDAVTEFEASNGAQTWTFKLRPDVTFSDGRRLTANDVIASMRHHMGEESKSAAKDMVDPIAEMRADGDEVVVFDLIGPNADFPYLMADYHLLLMPANEDGTANWQDYIGTGGYVLQEFEPGVRSLLTRRDDYWKEGRAHFDELELLVVTDVAARQNALATGDVDMISRVDLKTVGLLQQRPGLRVEEETGFLHYTFPMITTQDPYTDNELRLALKHAVNRQAMVDSILFGHGSVGNDQPIAPSVPFYNAELEQRTYDPDRARFHLKNAGFDSIDLTVATSDAAYAGAVDATVLMREHMAAAGINLTVDRKPADGYWSNVWMNEPFSACYWGGRPTCDFMFTNAYTTGANWNDTFWSHERFDELLIMGRAELDPAVRAEIYAEMQEIVKDEGGVIVWAFANYVYAMADKVQHGPDVAANWELDGGRFVERWWFA